ncbi:hypothetical protein AAMO2058_000413100 [Amorphochlora amoebiformis]
MRSGLILRTDWKTVQITQRILPDHRTEEWVYCNFHFCNHGQKSVCVCGRWAEQRPSDWWRCLVEATEGVLKGLSAENRRKIQAISIVATTCTLVCVDSDDAIGNALLWSDVRASKEADRVWKHRGNQINKTTPKGVSAEWLIPKALWVKTHRPDVWKRTQSVMEMHDYLCFRLTLRRISSINTATQRALYDSSSESYPIDLLEKIGLSDLTDKLPPVIRVGERVGHVSGDVIIELGLGKGVEVICGGGDAFVGLLGMGVANAGDYGLMTGSSNVIAGFEKNPGVELVRSIHNKGVFGPFRDAVIPGLELIEAGQPSSGSMLVWMRKMFAQGLTFQQLDREAAEVPIGSGGVLVFDCFQGSRTPYVDSKVRGAIIGLSLATTRQQLYRAGLESVAFATRLSVESVSPSSHPKLESKDTKAKNVGWSEGSVSPLVVVGGATRSSFFMQIYADVLGRELLTLSTSNAALLSAAIVAASGASISGGSLAETSRRFTKQGRKYVPDANRHEQYSIFYQLYKNLYPALRPTMHQLCASNNSHSHTKQSR